MTVSCIRSQADSSVSPACDQRHQVGGGRVGVQHGRGGEYLPDHLGLRRVGRVEHHGGLLVAELDGPQRVVGVADRVAGRLDVHGQRTA
jgi:hypothetical protein